MVVDPSTPFREDLLGGVMRYGIEPDDNNAFNGLGPRSEFPEIIKRIASGVVCDVLEDLPVFDAFLFFDIDLPNLIAVRYVFGPRDQRSEK